MASDKEVGEFLLRELFPKFNWKQQHGLGLFSIEDICEEWDWAGSIIDEMAKLGAQIELTGSKGNGFNCFMYITENGIRANSAGALESLPAIVATAAALALGMDG